MEVDSKKGNGKAAAAATVDSEVDDEKNVAGAGMNLSIGGEAAWRRKPAPHLNLVTVSSRVVNSPRVGTTRLGVFVNTGCSQVP